MAKARGYRSEYMGNRWEKIADKLLDAAEKAADEANGMVEVDPRKFQALMQAADASMRAYASVTKGDIIISQQEATRTALSMMDQFFDGLGHQVAVGAGIGEAMRRSGVTDPVLIYGADGKAPVGDYGQGAGDVLRDGKRRVASLVQA